jgi:hypothetical protein
MPAMPCESSEAASSIRSTAAIPITKAATMPIAGVAPSAP